MSHKNWWTFFSWQTWMWYSLLYCRTPVSRLLDSIIHRFNILNFKIILLLLIIIIIIGRQSARVSPLVTAPAPLPQNTVIGPDQVQTIPWLEFINRWAKKKKPESQADIFLLKLICSPPGCRPSPHQQRKWRTIPLGELGWDRHSAYKVGDPVFPSSQSGWLKNWI